MSGFLDVLESLILKVPGAEQALAKIDAYRARFLAIPAMVQANQAALIQVKTRAVSAADYDRVTKLQMEGQAIASGFGSTLAQLQHAEDLKASQGVGSIDFLTSALSLATTMKSTLDRSDALTAHVKEAAAAAGVAGPSPVAIGAFSNVPSWMWFAGGAVLLYALTREGRHG